MILPVLNYSDAMTVKFGITLIKIKDVVSTLIFISYWTTIKQNQEPFKNQILDSF
jgi:hypothetical protein